MTIKFVRKPLGFGLWIPETRYTYGIGMSALFTNRDGAWIMFARHHMLSTATPSIRVRNYRLRKPVGFHRAWTVNIGQEFENHEQT